MLPNLAFFILSLVLFLAGTHVTCMNVSEEYFTIYVHSTAENMTKHLYKDVALENDQLIVKSSPNISNVSVYSAFNIHAIDKGTHKISIGTRSNGLIEALLCIKQDAQPLSSKQKEVSLFGNLFHKIEGFIEKNHGFELFTNNKTHRCEGIMLSPERLFEVQAGLNKLLKAILASFIPRIPDAHPEKIWENRFNLEIVASHDHIDCIALYVILPIPVNGLRFSTLNISELFFSFRSKQEVFEVYVNVSSHDNKFVDRGTYLYTPLTYYTQEQSFNGTGLHPKLTRKFALEVNRKEVYSRLKSDLSCIILIQESLDKGNYIAIDEVKDDKDMKFYTFGVIDIERPSSHSSQHTYFIKFFMNASSYISHDDSKNLLWINYTTPYHFRYQSAGMSEYTKVNVWETSQIYISCQGYEGFKMDEYNRMESGYLDFLEEKFSRRFSVVPNSRNDNLIIATYNVPTGLVDHGPMATYISIGISILSCLILVLYISKHKGIPIEKPKQE